MGWHRDASPERVDHLRGFSGSRIGHPPSLINGNQVVVCVNMISQLFELI